MRDRLSHLFRELCRSARENHGRTVVLGTLVVATLIIVAVRLVEPRSLIVLDLTAEYVVQKVTRPELASIPLANAVQTSGRPCTSKLAAGRINGVLRPEAGTILRYRWSPGRIAVLVEAPETPRSAVAPDKYKRTLLMYADRAGEYQECSLADRYNAFVVEFDGSNEEALATAWPLPIAGPAEVGAELRVPNVPKASGQRDFNLLIEGDLQIFGKAIMPSFQDALFPALSNPLVIPAASRVASSGNVTAAEDAGAAWYGVAFIAKNGFRISATTETSELHIFRPGIEKGQREYFAIGLFTQILNDPSLAFISFCFVVIVAVAQVMSGWVGVWQRRERPNGPDPERTGASERTRPGNSEPEPQHRAKTRAADGSEGREVS